MSDRKPPDLPWRSITERLFSMLAAWETDHRPSASHFCVVEMHHILDAYEEAWQDLVAWERQQKGQVSE